MLPAAMSIPTKGLEDGSKHISLTLKITLNQETHIEISDDSRDNFVHFHLTYVLSQAVVLAITEREHRFLHFGH